MTSIPNQDRDAARPPKSLRFLVPFALVCLGVTGIWLGFDIAQLREWLGSLGTGAPIIFVLISIVLMSTFVPKTAVSVTAGALFGAAIGTGLMVIIAVAAAAMNYAIGRWWLHDSIRQSLLEARGALPNEPGDSPKEPLPKEPGLKDPEVTPEDPDAYREAQDAPTSSRKKWARVIAGMAADAGFSLHLLIRLSPVPTMLISYSMGALNCRIRPYLWASAVAIIPQSAWVHAGSVATTLHGPDASALRFISVAISVLVAILVSVIVPREAFKRLQSMKP